MLPETLLAYGLPWDWDEVRETPSACLTPYTNAPQHDSEYIIIKKWITEDLQEELFAHTLRIRHQKEHQRVIAQTSHSMTELRVNDRNKDKMFLVRKKSPKGRFRVFA